MIAGRYRHRLGLAVPATRASGAKRSHSTALVPPRLNLQVSPDDQSHESRGFLRPRGRGTAMLTAALMTVWALGSFTLVMLALFAVTGEDF
jgi:hypothetical protein